MKPAAQTNYHPGVPLGWNALRQKIFVLRCAVLNEGQRAARFEIKISIQNKKTEGSRGAGEFEEVERRAVKDHQNFDQDQRSRSLPVI